MNNENKIFRIFCIFSIGVLCALLITTGLLTAKNQTEQTVFGSGHKVLRIYQKQGGAVMSDGDKIAQLSVNDYSKAFDIISHTVLAPIDNIIEFIKNITAAI